MIEEEYYKQLFDINDEYARKVIDEDEHAQLTEDLREEYNMTKPKPDFRLELPRDKAERLNNLKK